MKKNMGTVDRTIRILAAIAIGVLYYTGKIGGTLAIVLGVFAVVFVITSFMGRCPAYVPLGISTHKEPPGSAGA